MRLYDNRLDLYFGNSVHLTLQRGRPFNPTNKHVVEYRHVIHSLRRKSMARLNVLYRSGRERNPHLPKCFQWSPHPTWKLDR